MDGAAQRRGPGEIAEDEATGLVAETYERLREALGVAFVPTVFRLLARWDRFLADGVDGVLATLDAAAIDQLAARIRARAGAAADALARPALDAGADAAAAGELLRRYNVTNPRGIAVVQALRGMPQRTTAPVMRAPLPAPAPELLDDVLACHGGLTVPGVWRELAAGHPALARRSWDAIRPLAGEAAFEEARAAVGALAREAVADVAAPDPLALGYDEHDARQIFTILDWFVVAIPTAVVEIELLGAWIR